MCRYTAVISSEAEKAIEALSGTFNIVPLPPDKTLDLPVRCHADMVLFVLGNKAVLPRSYAESYPYICDKLSIDTGIEIISDSYKRGKRYPDDIGLNVLLCGGIAFSLKAHTSNEVKKVLEDNFVKHVNVRQGYSACSSLSIGDAVITADEGIAAAAQNEGIDALLISRGAIRLNGYNEGFIGGASGVCGRCAYFLGNIDRHPDGKKIRGFIESHGFDCISLFDGELYDYGGIKFIENKHHVSDNRKVQLP